MGGYTEFDYRLLAIALLFRTLHQNIMAIFLLIIAIIIICFILYLSSDGYIFDKGRKTEGIITDVQSRSQTDQYGKVHVSYIVSYRFNDSEDRVWRGKFTVKSSTCRFKEEDTVTVYYLADKPYKNVVSR
ncbi:MAG: DUF3592 domain-containing protein [Cyanobacteria bacterium J06629_2]